MFPQGATIFREGDNGNRAYIVQRGRVEFYKSVDREGLLLGSVGAGGIFGEMALIDDQPRMATAVVSEPAVCIVISEAHFQKKLAALDPFLAGVLRILVENIRSIQDARTRPGYYETAPAMLPAADGGTGEASDSFEVA